MALRTNGECEIELKALYALYERLPSAWINLAACIRTIENRFNEGAVYEEYDTEDTAFPYALHAAMWLEGTEDDAPSVGWNVPD